MLQRPLIRRLFGAASRHWTALCMVIAAIGLALPADAADAWLPIATHAYPVPAAKPLGPMADSSPVRISVVLQVREQAALHELADRMMSGGAAPLTWAGFMKRFAPSADQAEKVAAYLQSKGFEDLEISKSRILVSATGSARAIREAFRVQLQEYDADGRRAFANATDAQVPAALNGVVRSVVGLQNVQRAFVPKRGTSARTAMNVSGCPADPKVKCLNQFEAIYHASSLPTASQTTVGIVTYGNAARAKSDVAAFATVSGYPTPLVDIVNVAGTGGNTANELNEWSMDAEAVLAAAGGEVGHIIFYNAHDNTPQALTVAYDQAISDNQAGVISVSLQMCENAVIMGSEESKDDPMFAAAMVTNRTFSVATGDRGDFSCENYEKYGYNLSYPSVSPYVMAIGGTTLTTSGSTWKSEAPWSCHSYCSCLGLDGQEYHPERNVANTDPNLVCQYNPNGLNPPPQVGGEGAGYSATQDAGSWQLPVLGGNTHRAVPDIAFDGNVATGAWAYVSSAQGAYSWVQLGGTSLAAPLFAGFFARVQSANNNQVLMPAGALYREGLENPQWFNSVGHSGWSTQGGFGSLQMDNFAAGMRKYNLVAAPLMSIIQSTLLSD